MSTFAQQYAFGKLGESAIANWIKAQGMHIIPVYEKQDDDYKGPTLFAAEGDALILPDLLAMQPVRDGRIRLVWCEAKNKSTFTMYRKTRTWQTGIEARHFEQYLEVQRRTTIPVHLLFLQNGGRDKETGQESPQGLYGNRLAYLVDHVDHPGTFYDEQRRRTIAMVYWNISDLRFLAPLPSPHHR
jgi:hypothetical protein